MGTELSLLIVIFTIAANTSKVGDAGGP